MQTLQHCFMEAGIATGHDLGDITITFPPGEDEDDDTGSGYTGTENEDNPFPLGYGWPSAVPVTEASWDTSQQPAKYKTVFGDTFSGLAATYLNDPARWQEIWDVQSQEYRWSHNADDLATGEWLVMPDEARDAYLNWINQGKPTTTKPGELKPETYGQKVTRYAPYLIGGGLLAVAGTGLYFAMS